MRLLTSKCASRLGGVPIFEVASSKTAQGMRCFATFDFQMCFAPRRHANFPSCISKTAPSMRCFAKCASRLGGVPIFVSPSVKGLRARRFSQPTVHHPLKNTSFRDFPSISRSDLLSSDCCDLLSSDSLFSDCAHWAGCIFLQVGS